MTRDLVLSLFRRMTDAELAGYTDAHDESAHCVCANSVLEERAEERRHQERHAESVEAIAASPPGSPDGSPSEGSGSSRAYEQMLSALPDVPSSSKEAVRDEESPSRRSSGGVTALPSLREESSREAVAAAGVEERSRVQRLLGLWLGRAVMTTARLCGAVCGIGEALAARARRCIGC